MPSRGGMVTGSLVVFPRFPQLAAMMPDTLSLLTISKTRITVTTTTAMTMVRAMMSMAMNMKTGIAIGLLVVFPHFPQLAAKMPDTLSPLTISKTRITVTMTTVMTMVRATMSMAMSKGIAIGWLAVFLRSPRLAEALPNAVLLRTNPMVTITAMSTSAFILCALT